MSLKHGVIAAVAVVAAVSSIYGVYYGTSLAGFCWTTCSMEVAEEDLARCAFAAIAFEGGLRSGHSDVELWQSDPIVTDYDEAKRLAEDPATPGNMRMGQMIGRPYRVSFYHRRRVINWQRYGFDFRLARRSGEFSAVVTSVDRCGHLDWNHQNVVECRKISRSR